MFTQRIDHLHEPARYETHPLIVTMQEFLDYATCMAEYSSLACGFVGLNEKMIDAAERVLEFATKMKTVYHDSLMQESVEELLQKEKNILCEIEACAYYLAICELSLDKCLIFADTYPEISSAFLTKDGLPLFDTASC